MLMKTTSFDWRQEKWLYKKRDSREPIIVTDMDSKEEGVPHYHNPETKKTVGVWKSLDGSMNNQVKILLYKYK